MSYHFLGLGARSLTAVGVVLDLLLLSHVLLHTLTTRKDPRTTPGDVATVALTDLHSTRLPGEYPSQLQRHPPRARRVKGAVLWASPISSIPPEILLRVFFLLVDKSKDATRRRRDDVAIVSQVCRLWRQVALGSGALWASNINWNTFYPNSWWEEVLKRTGDGGIDFAVNMTWGYHLRSRKRNPNIRKLKEIAKERVRSLELVFDSYMPHWGNNLILETLTGDLAGPFPFLQRLSLTANCYHFPDNSLPSMDTWHFLETHPRCLQVLHLKMFNPNFDHFPTFYNLRELSVIDIRSPVPTISKWLTLLRVMPHLTDLTIKGSISPEPSSANTRTPVLLPKLTTLGLAGRVGSGDGIDVLLSYIETPSGCSLYFAGRFLDSSAALNDAGLVAWLRRWKDVDYQSRSLHACLDPQRVVLHNQSGPAPWPGLWFRISFESASRRGSGASLRRVRQVTPSLVSLLGKAIARSQHLTLWTPVHLPQAGVALAYQRFLLLFRSLQTLCITATDRHKYETWSLLDSFEHLTEVLGPFARRNALSWTGLKNIYPSLNEIVVRHKNEQVRFVPGCNIRY